MDIFHNTAENLQAPKEVYIHRIPSPSIVTSTQKCEIRRVPCIYASIWPSKSRGVVDLATKRNTSAVVTYVSDQNGSWVMIGREPRRPVE